MKTLMRCEYRQMQVKKLVEGSKGEVDAAWGDTR